MGCLNSDQGFDHWFGNIHLSGPCNRSCYFCIGQHMQDLDPLINLDTWPLDNLGEFVRECKEKNVNEVNVTGSNTDPLLYKHTKKLRKRLDSEFDNLKMGIRTNGILAFEKPEIIDQYDKGSFSITTFDPDLYKKTMGQGTPPNVEEIVQSWPEMDWKANVVLCPETVVEKDILKSIEKFQKRGVKKVNLREPYGQPPLGNPLQEWGFEKDGEHFGMPYYMFGDLEVTYWDVHTVHVESVNLYANGEVSITYPVTEGHSPENGKVEPQSEFEEFGRQKEQWNYN